MAYMQRYATNAFIHVDADAFFASCEQAVNPAYRGKPLVTGKERGIVAAASYEAKAKGVKRGVPLWEVKKICPEAIVLPSNYETYSLFSKRMFDIMRRFTSEVEEYSIDEAFADLTGLRRPLNMTYPQIAAAIKEAIEKDLGITVSVGLAATKVLCKVASKWDKPSGFVYIRNRDAEQFLKDLPTEEVWGIGLQTARHLLKHGITTAWEFAQKPEDWVKSHFTKPHQELWEELNGHSVYKIERHLKNEYQTISKTRTFSPASTDKDFVFGQLSKNVENAFIKARRHQLAGRKMVVFLKSQDFRYRGVEVTLNRPTSFPNEAMPIVRKVFDGIFVPGTEYRATGAIITHLQTDEAIQMNLFESPLVLEKQKRLFASVDELSKKYGKHTLCLGSSLPANTISQHKNFRGHIPDAKQRRESQLHKRKFVGLPLLLGKVN
ncbi:MAG: DNA polymerase IV [Candidatus Kerfeldbacteria bacterium]